ncbi:palmitoyltransferase [Starmerella bacillaris]|uniref:Synaptobrevin homolog YKT6 n=1 Tax=Starmerella bacillaris TaxID=1247836 RepID=A0AAV5RFM0_STABA|nr:palmitoyltransferase [Starmerella bacillaris]
MKIYYLGILKGGQDAVELCKAKDVSSFSFFERSSVDQFMTFFSTTIAARTEKSQRQSIEEGNYMGHVYVRQEGLAGVVISDKEYPVRVSFSILNKILDEYLAQHPKEEWESATNANKANMDLSFAPLELYLKRYQDPHQADALLRVQQELDDTKIVLHKTIESVLQRGEKLDTLVDKSEALSSSSKMFYTQARKTNSCCVLL